MTGLTLTQNLISFGFAFGLLLIGCILAYISHRKWCTKKRKENKDYYLKISGKILDDTYTDHEFAWFEHYLEKSINHPSKGDKIFNWNLDPRY